MNRQTTFCHAPSALQLAIRVFHTRYKQLYVSSKKRGATGFKMIRTLMENFVQKAEQQNG